MASNRTGHFVRLSPLVFHFSISGSASKHGTQSNMMSSESTGPTTNFQIMILNAQNPWTYRKQHRLCAYCLTTTLIPIQTPNRKPDGNGITWDESLQHVTCICAAFDLTGTKSLPSIWIHAKGQHPITLHIRQPPGCLQSDGIKSSQSGPPYPDKPTKD